MANRSYFAIDLRPTGRWSAHFNVVFAAAAWMGAALLPVVGAAAEQVHSSNFDDPKAISPDWSATPTEVTRAGRRRFLGEFSNDTVALSLKELPKHQFVRVSFDLFILKSWNGSLSAMADAGHKNQWGLRVEGGPTLLQAGFANTVLSRASPARQTFPALIPGEMLPPGTRAAENNTLGYPEFGGDSVYKMSFTFPHSAGAIQFLFYAENLEEAENESWGLDNVTVEVLTADEVPALNSAALALLWDDLGTADPVKGFDTAWKMIEQGDAAVTFAERMLAADASKAPKVDKLSARVKQLVAELDADEFRVRQRAMRELLAIGDRAAPALRSALKSPTSAEVRSRVEQILTRIDDVNPATLSDDERRHERLIFVLKVIGSPGAKRILVHLTAS